MRLLENWGFVEIFAQIKSNGIQSIFKPKMETKFLKTHLVIVEGETEEGFFTAFVNDKKKEAFVDIKKLTLPASEIEKRINEEFLNQYQVVILVMDHDNNPDNRVVFERLARNYRVVVADSNPCFEAFLLFMHVKQIKHWDRSTSDDSPQKMILEWYLKKNPKYKKGFEGGVAVYQKYKDRLSSAYAELSNRRRPPCSNLYDALQLIEFIGVSTPPPTRF